jgi:hypothetical protein
MRTKQAKEDDEVTMKEGGERSWASDKEKEKEDRVKLLSKRRTSSGA